MADPGVPGPAPAPASGGDGAPPTQSQPSPPVLTLREVQDVREVALVHGTERLVFNAARITAPTRYLLLTSPGMLTERETQVVLEQPRPQLLREAGYLHVWDTAADAYQVRALGLDLGVDFARYGDASLGHPVVPLLFDTGGTRAMLIAFGLQMIQERLVHIAELVLDHPTT